MWQIESHTSLGWRRTSACMTRHRIICLGCVHRSLKLLNNSTFVPPAAIYTRCSTVSAWYVRPSHLRCRWTNDMELVPKQFAWAGHANWLFSSYTENISFWKRFFLNSTGHVEHIRGVIFATMRYINGHLHYSGIEKMTGCDCPHSALPLPKSYEQYRKTMQVYTSVRYPKPPNSINSTILFTYFIVTHRNAR